MRVPDPDKRWWTAENGSGEKGFVPTNFLKFRASAAQQHFKSRWKGGDDKNREPELPSPGKQHLTPGKQPSKGWSAAGASVSSFLGSVTRATEKTKAGMAGGIASARKGGGYFTKSISNSTKSLAKGWLGRLKAAQENGITSGSNSDGGNASGGGDSGETSAFPAATVAASALSVK